MAADSFLTTNQLSFTTITSNNTGLRPLSLEGEQMKISNYTWALTKEVGRYCKDKSLDDLKPAKKRHVIRLCRYMSMTLLGAAQ